MGNKKTLRELFHDIKVNHLSIEDQITQTDPDLILLVCVTANAPECQDLLTFLKVAYWEWEPEPCKTIVIVCNLETDKCTYREEIMMSLAAEEWIIIQNFEDSSAVYECVYDHNDPGVPRMITLKQNLETIDNRADKTLLSSLDHSAVLRMWLPDLPSAVPREHAGVPSAAEDSDMEVFLDTNGEPF